MRFYNITISDPVSGAVLIPPGMAASGQRATYTSLLPDGMTTNPAAMNVEFEIPQYPYATPQQGSWLRIWGIGLAEMSLSYGFNLNLKNIVIEAGMKKGLPLAKPAQAGIIAQGTVFQPFGNWQQTNMTLEMILLPPAGSAPDQIFNIPFDYPDGTPLQQAVQQSLQTAVRSAVPKIQVNVTISPLLKFSGPMKGSYTSLSAFSSMLQKLTLDQQFNGITTLAGGKYPGVSVRLVNNIISVYDGTQTYGGTSPQSPKVIAFEDMIGQPTWIGPAAINFKTVLRGDISVGDYVLLPDGLAVPYVLTTPGASLPSTTAPSRNNSTFKGVFLIVGMRSFANSRSPLADAWATSFNATFASDLNSLVTGVKGPLLGGP